MSRTTTGRGQRAPKGVMKRLIRTIFEFYPVLLPITLGCFVKQTTVWEEIRHTRNVTPEALVR